MEVDVPAAHSVDSEWYAVDETGEVAVFETGEAGGLPEKAGVVGGEARDASSERAVLVIRALAFALAREADADSPAQAARSAEGWEAELRSEAMDAPARRHLLLRFDAPPTATNLERIHQGRWWWGLTPALTSTEREAAAAGASLVVSESELYGSEYEVRGLTVYGNDDSERPGAYERETRGPAMTVTDLPADVAGQVSTLKLPVRFAERASLQLTELGDLGPILTWGGTLGDAPESPATPAPRRSWLLPLMLGALLIALALGFLLR